MTFIQPEFLYLMGIVLTLYWGLCRFRVAQNLLLIVVSFVFYGWIHPWFCTLLLFSSVLDYSIGLAMGRHADGSPGRKRLLWLSMAGNLGMLGYFKYANFFLDNVVAVSESVGLQANVPSLQVILPVGISFYTFQTMSYTIDLYRGKLEARRNFIDYLVFVSFFPQLVAGPVERASRLLPQVEEPRSFSLSKFWSGLGLAMWGGFKKICIADTVAPYVDTVFIHSDPNLGMVAVATLGFAIQILADFSGYTDIARGVSRMLGFELVLNFRNPYLATNPSDFWKRWHISFSTWIRDYLYIPLGGSRGGKWGTIQATFGAMLLSGLWHGASWTFVIWGAYHAVLITGYRAVTKRIPDSLRRASWSRAVSIPLMFFFTCVGWLIFRETHIDRLAGYFTLAPFGGSEDQWIAATILLAVCVVVSLPLLLALVSERFILERIRHSIWELPFRTLTWTAMALAMFTLTRLNTNDFIYFQF